MEENPSEKPLEIPVYAMEDPATYKYFTTFFRASTRYINSIEDVEKKQENIMSFSRQFYDSMLTMIVKSLYKTFIVEEEGALFVADRYRDGLKVVIPADLLEYIKSLSATIEYIAPSIEALWSSAGVGDTYIQNQIQNNMTRLAVLTEIIDPDTYKEYIKSPYQVESGSLYIFPAIDPITKIALRFDPAKITSLKNIKILSGDPRINDLKKIWPDADASSWLVEGDNIRVLSASYKIARQTTQGTSRIKISALYKTKTFSDILIEYGSYQIRVSSENDMTTPVLYAFL